MSLHLGQLVHTSFPGVGFRTQASAQVPASVEQAFIQHIAHRYWDAYNPPEPGYRAAYLLQIAPEQTLFGWLYNDGADDLGRGNVPYFLCYYLGEVLQTTQLQTIFDCLVQGPIDLLNRQIVPVLLEPILLPETCDYQPARTGVAIPAEIRDRSAEVLQQKNLLDLFVPVHIQQIASSQQPQVFAKDPSAASSLVEETQTPDVDTAIAQTPLKTARPGLVAKPASASSLDQQQPRRSPVTKIALLIGVSDCGPGFEPLPGVQKDVAVLQQVLEHPEIGGFTEVKALINPDRQTMAEAIEALFGGRQSDDLVLLYFSGHAAWDDKGKLFLSTCLTSKVPPEKLVRSTVVPASFIDEVMGDSRSHQQVMILDCCFSEVFTQGWSVEANHFVNVKRQLGGPGRMVLTGSTSTRMPFGQKGSELSAYTFYLIEGLETGAADFDGDGMIAIDEWHEYARRKIQIATPATKPRIYGIQSSDKILIASTPKDNSKLKYRKGVEYCASRGQVSLVDRTLLDVLKNSLGLLGEEAATIETSVLRPHKVYQMRLQEYAKAFIESIQHEFPIREDTYTRFKHFQASLGLTNEQVAPLESKLTRRRKVVHSPDLVSQSSRLLALTGANNASPVQRFCNQAAGMGNVIVLALAARAQEISRSLQQTLLGGNDSSIDYHSLLSRRKPWLLVGLGAATILAITGIASGLDQRQQQQDSQRLQSIKQLVAQRNYEACIIQANKIAHRRSAAQSFLQQCQAGVNWQNAQVQNLAGHSGPIWTVAISADGQTLVSGGADSNVKVWDLPSGKLRHTLSGHDDTVWSVAISADGKTLASGSSDKTIKVWSVPSGKLLRTLSGHNDTVWSVAISANGKILASGGEDKIVKVWSVPTGKLVSTLSGYQDTVRAVAISPNGQVLASGSSDKTIKVWNLRTGALAYSLSGHRERVTSVAMSPKDQTLVSGSRDKTVKVWNLQTGELLRTLPEQQPVNAVAINPIRESLPKQASQLVASGSGPETKLWSLPEGKILRTFPGNSGDITAIVFSQDGERLIRSTQNKTIQVWQR